MLIAYEDQRFFEHKGVDPIALVRAAWQFATHGRIVSGASTLSMQVARLIEPREGRSFAAKFRQLARAVQIERRLSKAEILDLYLTHAPYGGNLEGIRAASLAYFGKEPRRLTVSEAAPSGGASPTPGKAPPRPSSESRRDGTATGFEAHGRFRRDRRREAERAGQTAVPERRLQLPAFAAHVAEAARRKEPAVIQHQTTLRRNIQKGLETVAKEAAARLGPKVSIAMVMADARTGEIVGELGSADYFDASRSGWIDMTRISRSPGSTLKPFIYAWPSRKDWCRRKPSSKTGRRISSATGRAISTLTYQGDVSIRQALQLSLNVPAVRLLDAVGPTRLMVRFRRAEVRPILPANEAPGLAIGLGGLGINLKDLVQLYAGLANRGKPVRLGDGIREQPGPLENEPLLDAVATWQIADILSGVLPPAGAVQRGIATRPARATATAMPGPSGSMAAMFWVSGLAARTMARSLA